MTSFVSHTSVDCRDAYALSTWWKQVLEYVVADHSDIHGPGIGWVTMADPEGNEFCVLRSEAEIAVASRGSAGGSADGSTGGPAAGSADGSTDGSADA